MNGRGGLLGVLAGCTSIFVHIYLGSTNIFVHIFFYIRIYIEETPGGCLVGLRTE